MTEPLIPYTFVPGTKAKAQEVNANFLSLAEQIQDVQSSATSQVSDLQTVLEGQIEEVEENIANNYSSKDLSNSGMITNTILEAPNGVVSYEGNIITVASGLKVLMPNGRTDDDRLQNIEYITESAIEKTFTNLSNAATTLFLNNDGTVEAVYRNYIYFKSSTPTTLSENVRWYNTTENKWYKYNVTESSWQTIVTTPIATVDWDASSYVSSLVASQPLNLVKLTDLNDFYTIRGILPRNLDYVIERYQNSWSFYTLYKSGWVKQGGCIEGSGGAIANFYFAINPGYHISIARTSGAGTTSDIGVWVREVQPSYIHVYSPSNTGKVWCTEGFRTSIEEY